MLVRPDVEPGGTLPEAFLRIAVVFADGRVATNLAGHQLRAGGPIPADQPVLAPGHGSSGGRRADMTYWLTPLPPSGPLVFVCEWPVHGIGESRAELDATVILDAVSLDELLAVYPNALTREELAAAAAGLEVRGGTLSTYLSTLRRNHLVTNTGKHVRADEVFFLDPTG